MPQDLNLFRIVVMGVFLAFAVVAVIVFALIRADTSSQTLSKVEVWGTLPTGPISDALSYLDAEGILSNVQYRQFPEETYYETLLEALASGAAPDLFILDQSNTIPFLNKTFAIAYELMPARTFKDTYLDGAQAYMFNEGVYAIPFAIDPLVMFWNRDYFSTKSVTLVPKYWDEFPELVPKLTELDGANEVRRSGVGLGEYDNVSNAKGILSALFMQAGGRIVTPSAYLEFRSSLATDGDASEDAAVAALQFYTEYANPLKTVYSWNKALGSSRSEFIAGDLAIYFGFASEAEELRAANPNLNFDIAVLPQRRSVNTRSTYARMYAFAVPRSSSNPLGALEAAQRLTSAEAVSIFSRSTLLPPIRRDLLAVPQTGAYWSVAYDSAIISRTWFEPNKVAVNGIFRSMVNNVTSGRDMTSSAVSTANRELGELVK